MEGQSEREKVVEEEEKEKDRQTLSSPQIRSVNSYRVTSFLKEEKRNEKKKKKEEKRRRKRKKEEEKKDKKKKEIRWKNKTHSHFHWQSRRKAIPSAFRT